MLKFEMLFDDEDFIYVKEIDDTEIINRKISVLEFDNYKKDKIEA